MILFFLSACSILFADNVEIDPIPEVPLEGPALALAQMVNVTEGKITSEYADSIIDRAQDSSLVFRSGPATGMFEVSGLMADDGLVTVLQDGKPLWESYRYQGDMTLVAGFGQLPGRPEDDGSLTLFGTNDAGHDNGNLIDHFAVTLDSEQTQPVAVSLFRGWNVVKIVRPANAPGPDYALAMLPNRALMFIGFPEGTEFQIAVIRPVDLPRDASGAWSFSLDPKDVRVCTVPSSDRYTGMTWSSCKSF